MLGQSPVCATIAVHDINTAKQFYSETLGLTLEDDSPGGVLFASGQSKLFVYESQYAGTNQATAATWKVDDVDACVNELKGKGVSFDTFELPGMSWEGDIAVIGSMRAAWFKDPDGNILNVMSGEM